MCPNLKYLLEICTVPFVVVLCGLSLSAEVSIKSLEPTVLFPRREPLAQIAKLTVENTDDVPLNCSIDVEIVGGTEESIHDVQLVPGCSTVDVLVPDISQEETVRVIISDEQKFVASFSKRWIPQRKWKVHLVKSSHEDLGYEDYIFIKQHDIAKHIDMAVKQSDEVIDTIDGPKYVGYHYAMETILFQRNYIEERSEQEYRKLLDEHLKNGPRLSIWGAPSGVHTHWMDYEEIARVGYPARRESKDRFDLNIDTITMVDNPSLSWSGMQAFAASGFRYVARFGQNWRTGGNNNYATTKVPAVFWWESPDQEHRVLLSWSWLYAGTFWWGQTNGGRNWKNYGLPEIWVNTYLKSIESDEELGPYPYDALMLPVYRDHEIPKFDNRKFRLWAQTYAYPELIHAPIETYFHYMEDNYGDDIPTLKGDLNNFSADYATIDPESQGWKRKAARLLPATEGLGVIASFVDPAYSLLPKDAERIYTRFYDYDEHSWPTSPEPNDFHLFNASWIKKQEGLRALNATSELFREIAKVVGSNISVDESGAFAVFNPLIHSRSDYVRVKGNADYVVDLRSGERLPCHQVDRNEYEFLAKNIPSFGYALFSPEKDPKRFSDNASLSADKFSISNEYYTVRFHEKNGSIVSIIERETGRELIDSNCEYLGNQLVYVETSGKITDDATYYTPQHAISHESDISPVKATFRVMIEDPALGGRIEQIVSLYSGVKEINIENRLTDIESFFTEDYQDRYCKNIYFAFPFKVNAGEIRAEYPGGVVRPYEDQLRWGTHDYLHANRWIDVSNDDHGITLSTGEVPTFSLGEIRYNKFSIDYKPQKPWIFNYVWSNRMAGLLTLHPEECDAVFTYSITSHEGDWDSGEVSDFGWRTASPLLTIPLDHSREGGWPDKSKSILSVDNRNVQMTVLKNSGIRGKGIVARFVETDGKDTCFEFDPSFFGIEEAYLCDMVENDIRSLELNDGKISLEIPAFGFVTVRMVGGVRPHSIENIKVGDVTDSEIQLSWSEPIDENIAYDIYRSEDPDAPSTVYNQVARVKGNHFQDRGLNPNTTYYYQVATVTSTNIEGPLSEVTVVKTSTENHSAPMPVAEPGVVRRASDTLFVFWRKSPEPDTARYHVYRAEKEDFDANEASRIATIDATSMFLQVYKDTGLRPDTTYYYRILPEDWAANMQTESSVVSGTTPKKLEH